MKIKIVSIHSQYIHSSPVPWILKQGLNQEKWQVYISEFSINDTNMHMLDGLLSDTPDIIAFSVYIWNIETVKRLICDIKMIDPNIIIILGGPEVSFDGSHIMKNISQIDYLICGEGEETLPFLCSYIEKRKELPAAVKNGKIQSLIFSRKNNEITETTYYGKDTFTESAEENFSSLKEMIKENKGRILYFETSRGCPFKCAYCLASLSEDVRYLSMDDIKRAIDLIALSDAEIIKFTDRTFNANRQRAYDIISYIKATGKKTWHFEVAADLFDEKLLTLIETLPKGLVQFEIGIQSLNERVLLKVGRSTDIEVSLHNIERLMKANAAMIHVDLIAGLPAETYQDFIEGFNRLHALFPHQLQLGFLKALKGTSIHREKCTLGMCFSETAPYQVLKTSDISWAELNLLMKAEDVLEKCWNSGRFILTVKAVVDTAFNGDYYSFYLALYYHLSENGYGNAPVSANNMCRLMCSFVKDIPQKELIYQCIAIDILVSGVKINIPEEILDRARKNCGINIKKEYPLLVQKAAEPLGLDPQNKGMVNRYLMIKPLPDGSVCAVNISEKCKVDNRYKYYIIPV